jgi:hypothetical protein
MRPIPRPSRASAARLTPSDSANAVAPDQMRYGSSGMNAPSVSRREWRPDRAHVEADLLEDHRADGILRLLEDHLDDPLRLLLREAALAVDPGEDGPLLVTCLADLLALECDLVVEQLPLALDGDELAHRHAECPGEETGDAREHDDRRSRPGARDAHDEGQVRDEPVIAPEDDRSQDRVAGSLVGFAGVGELVFPDGGSGCHRGTLRRARTRLTGRTAVWIHVEPPPFRVRTTRTLRAPGDSVQASPRINAHAPVQDGRREPWSGGDPQRRSS